MKWGVIEVVGLVKWRDVTVDLCFVFRFISFGFISWLVLEWFLNGEVIFTSSTGFYFSFAFRAGKLWFKWFWLYLHIVLLSYNLYPNFIKHYIIPWLIFIFAVVNKSVKNFNGLRLILKKKKIATWHKTNR